ncbi:hypothetical protein A176_002873 [Myxococcus hansupus]|uniref:Uncharacterized protein n=1 Tax=Pseudomyxococcus hansupus TaxID=1297742 RepID=A0A0H4WR33_9BACT|nr:hypothetical protein A176_002873 [Myxococcus hansupus]
MSQRHPRNHPRNPPTPTHVVFLSRRGFAACQRDGLTDHSPCTLGRVV